MIIANLTPVELRRAARIKEQIEKLQSELEKLLAAGAGSAVAPARKKFSRQGIARIRAAQKARWAKIKRASAVRVKRKLSAATKARIAAAQKKIWAERKARARAK